MPPSPLYNTLVQHYSQDQYCELCVMRGDAGAVWPEFHTTGRIHLCCRWGVSHLSPYLDLVGKMANIVRTIMDGHSRRRRY